MQNLKGTVAFVTGGSSGIGLATAKALAQEGVKVAFTYRNTAHLVEAMAYFRDRPEQRILPIRLEVTDRNAMRAAADEVEEILGPVQLLINNAGVGVRGPMVNATYDDWDWVLGVNVGGVVNGIVTFLPRMVNSGLDCHIVNVSSLGGVMAPDSLGVYTTSKYAVTGMSEALRNDLRGTRIGVSVFLPGPVQSNIDEAEKGRPEHLSVSGYRGNGAGGKRPGASPNAMTADEAARYVLDGIKQDKLFIFSNPEIREVMERRNAAMLAAIPDEPVSDARRALINDGSTKPFRDVPEGMPR